MEFLIVNIFSNLNLYFSISWLSLAYEGGNGIYEKDWNVII